jgi:SAM-dependent methyltransferase
METTVTGSASPDPEEHRLRFVLAGQQHADHYLTPLCDPRDKRVLVVGCGAGTDVLWCLRHGASEVVGIDVLEQGPEALSAAADRYGIDPSPARLVRLPIEDAATLGRRFDLVLANNVFEHVGDLPAAFAACAAVVEPGSGRVAIFSSPLYWSSQGSHLPHAAWEHLLLEPGELRRRLLASGELWPGHPLERLDLRSYLDREISLNRARLVDFVRAIGDSGLVLLHLGVLPDPRLEQLGEALGRLKAADDDEGTRIRPEPLDFALAGVALELALPAGAGGALLDPRSTADRRMEISSAEHGREIHRLQAAAAEAERQRAEAAALREVLASVEASWSFRLGRALTAPARGLRRLAGRGRG